MKAYNIALLLGIFLIITSFKIPTGAMWINFHVSYYVIHYVVIFRTIAFASIILVGLFYIKQRNKKTKIIKK